MCVFYNLFTVYTVYYIIFIQKSWVNKCFLKEVFINLQGSKNSNNVKYYCDF